MTTDETSGPVEVSALPDERGTHGGGSSADAAPEGGTGDSDPVAPMMRSGELGASNSYRVEVYAEHATVLCTTCWHAWNVGVEDPHTEDLAIEPADLHHSILSHDTEHPPHHDQLTPDPATTLEAPGQHEAAAVQPPGQPAAPPRPDEDKDDALPGVNPWPIP